jgi:DNA-binding MurR/RpiR family transcriptional regulator
MLSHNFNVVATTEVAGAPPLKVRKARLLPKKERAALAAEVLTGRQKLAQHDVATLATLFGISVSSIRAAQRLTPAQRQAVMNGTRSLVERRRPPSICSAWITANAQERDRAALSLGPAKVREVVDRVAAAQHVAA